MGTCQNKSVRFKHNDSHNAVIPKSNQKRTSTLNYLGSSPLQSSQDLSRYLGYPLNCLGYISVCRTNINKRDQYHEILGLGCLVAKQLLLASDHFMYLFQANQLQFHPLNRHIKPTPIKRCIYPSLKIDEKRKSMYLHKRLAPALYQLGEQTSEGSYLEIGTYESEDNDDDGIVKDNKKEDINELIDKSRRMVLITANKCHEQRGHPIIYHLYDRYYCVGLYSSCHTEDYCLFNDKVIERLINRQRKSLGNSSLSYISIDEAYISTENCSQPKYCNSIISELFESLESKKDNEVQCGEIYFSIGLQYGRRGLNEKEKQFYELAITSFQRSKEDSSQNLAALYHNLGVCLSELNKLPQAKDTLQKSLGMKLLRYGPSDMTIADSYNELGVVHKLMNCHQLSLKMYQKAYNIYSQHSAIQNMAFVKNNITLIKEPNQSHQNNQKQYTTILTTLIKKKGQNCLQVAIVLYNLAKIQQSCKNYGLSIDYLGKCLQIMRKMGLSKYSKYKMMAQTAKQINTQVLSNNWRVEWKLKSQGLLKLIGNDDINAKSDTACL